MRAFSAMMASVLIVFCALAPLARGAAPGPALGTNGGINDNRHNLSSQSLNPYRAISDPFDNRTEQICVFCHTPHNSSPQSPLWNRPDTTQVFGRYSSPSLLIRTPGLMGLSQYNEPNGSSRLCLSCHDGVNGLGQVVNKYPIPFANDKITGLAKFDAAKIKTGHHPISFVYSLAVAAVLATKTGPFSGTYRLPNDPAVPLDVAARVKLDKLQRMQCMTCHDPHQNQSDDAAMNPLQPGRKVVPFWVYHRSGYTASQDHDAVCTACHSFTNAPWVP